MEKVKKKPTKTIREEDKDKDETPKPEKLNKPIKLPTQAPRF